MTKYLNKYKNIFLIYPQCPNQNTLWEQSNLTKSDSKKNSEKQTTLPIILLPDISPI